MSPKVNLGLMLHKLGAMMEKQSDAVLFDEFGLGFSQFKIMMALEHHAGVQQKEIAHFLGQTEASISRQIKLLHDAGLLTVGERSEDRKKHVIELTAKGKRMSVDAFAVLQSYYQPVISQLTPAEQKLTLACLGKIYDKINELCNQKITKKD